MVKEHQHYKIYPKSPKFPAVKECEDVGMAEVDVKYFRALLLMPGISTAHK